MLVDGRYRYVLRRVADVVASSARCVTWLVSTLRGDIGPLWVGDSHAGHLTRCFSTANVLHSPQGDRVLHLGARLMYSIAKDGFPRWARRLLRLRGRLGRQRCTLVACLGEIDVRCHLAAHARNGEVDLAFVATYVALVLDLADACDAARVAFVVPPPPCLDQPDTARFPVRGSFEERVRMFDGLRDRLAREVTLRADLPIRCVVVDATDELWDPARGMLLEVSDDRCHVNAQGAIRVRRALHRGLATLEAG